VLLLLSRLEIGIPLPHAGGIQIALQTDRRGVGKEDKPRLDTHRVSSVTTLTKGRN
jgi:hypothetical protein